MAELDQEDQAMPSDIDLDSDDSMQDPGSGAEEEDVKSSKGGDDTASRKGSNGGGKEKSKAKGKAKADPAKPQAKRGKACKSKNGMKWCAPCGKDHANNEFPAGKAMCAKAWNAMRAVEAAALSQGKAEWWAATKANPSKFKRLISAYMTKVAPEVAGQTCKRSIFCVATYIEEYKQVEQLLIDGVYEMMNVAAYIHWAGKPKTATKTHMRHVIHGSRSSQNLWRSQTAWPRQQT